MAYTPTLPKLRDVFVTTTVRLSFTTKFFIIAVFLILINTLSAYYMYRYADQVAHSISQLEIALWFSSLIFLNSGLLFLLYAWIFKPIILMITTAKNLSKNSHSKIDNVFTRDTIGEFMKEIVDIIISQEITKNYLTESRAKYEAIIDSMGEGLIATDKEGNILMMNKIAQDLLSMNTNTILGKPLLELVQDKTKTKQANSYTHILEALKRGKKTTAIYYYHRKDLSKFPASVTISPIIHNNEIIGAIEIFRDISKEQEVDRMKTEFVSIASHQLRTPLSSMRWYSKMLLTGDGGVLTPDQRSMVQDLYKIVRGMIDLVNSLLNISRIESGKMNINLKSVALQTVITDEITKLQPKLKEKQLVLQTKITSTIPKITVDVLLIRQVIENFLTNAIKYTPEGQTISVEYQQYKNTAKFSITDTGIGIPKEEQYKVFKRFFRADNAKHSAADGNGLGLYFSKRVVEACGGEIGFESQDGKGSTFWFTIKLDL